MEVVVDVFLKILSNIVTLKASTKSSATNCFPCSVLKVNAKRSSLRLGSFPKLEARYYGSFEVLKKIGQISYMLALSASMRIHNVFHVSLLKTYVPHPNRVID
jgi:hypothetical protein